MKATIEAKWIPLVEAMTAAAGDEPIEAAQVVNTLYFFGSELATLRIYKRFHRAKTVIHQGYSENLGIYYAGMTVPSD